MRLKSTTPLGPRSPLAWLADFGKVASTVCSRPQPIHAILPVGQGGTPPVATILEQGDSELVSAKPF